MHNVLARPVLWMGVLVVGRVGQEECVQILLHQADVAKQRQIAAREV